MALHTLCCGSGALVLTAAVTLLLVPAPYLVPDFLVHLNDPDNSVAPKIVEIASSTNRFTLSQFPSLDLFPNVIILVIGAVVYLFEWIHRKLMEKRILKLRQLLGASAERLRAAEQAQAQLEGTLRLARSAATEYNLLLYLLLRRPAASSAPKPKDDDFAFLSMPKLDV